MPKSTLNFVWIGEPRFNQWAQDTIGPVTIDQNFKRFDPSWEKNPMVFWCQFAYQEAYKEYFISKGVTIEVKSIEQCISESNNEHANEILEIYNTLTSPERNQIIDRVYLKDLFFNFILATRGGYVLDTNIYPESDDRSVNFPEYATFMFPWLVDRNRHEVWMQYAPPGNLSRAKRSLDLYLKCYQKGVKSIFDTHGYSDKYHEYLGIAGNALTLNVRSETMTDYQNEMVDVWACGSQDKMGDDNIPELNLLKEYCNSHWNNSHAYLRSGNVKRLKFLLDHGIDLTTAVFDGLPLVDYCLELDHPDILSSLAVRDADSFIDKHYKFTLAWYAAKTGAAEVIKILAERKAVLNQAMFRGETPLFNAAFNGHQAVVEELLNAGVDLDTPLYFRPNYLKMMVATKGENIKRNMEELIQNKLNADAEITKINVSPQEIARVMGHNDIVQKFFKSKKEAMMVVVSTADEDVNYSIKLMPKSSLFFFKKTNCITDDRKLFLALFGVMAVFAELCILYKIYNGLSTDGVEPESPSCRM